MVSTTFTYLTRLRRDNYVDVVVDTIHVADAVADTDETYGAYAAAENDTFNNANGLLFLLLALLILPFELLKVIFAAA